jgi:hypothetical protein
VAGGSTDGGVLESIGRLLAMGFAGAGVMAGSAMGMLVDACEVSGCVGANSVGRAGLIAVSAGVEALNMESEDDTEREGGTEVAVGTELGECAALEVMAARRGGVAIARVDGAGWAL